MSDNPLQDCNCNGLRALTREWAR